MGLTERHWFENEDVPENYEWALEDAVSNSHTKMTNKEGALDKEQRQAALARLAIVFESAWLQAAQDNMKEAADIYYDLWTAVAEHIWNGRG